MGVTDSSNVEESRGYQLGITYAGRRGKRGQLKRFAKQREENQFNWDWQFEPEGMSGCTVQEHWGAIARNLYKTGFDRAEASEFWEAETGMPIETVTPEFVKGFVEGALSVYDEG